MTRRPHDAFLALAFGLAWAWWLPLAPRGDEVGVGTWPSQVPGRFAPAVAAVIVTATTRGRPSPPTARIGFPSRLGRRLASR